MTVQPKSVLWIDDNPVERAGGEAALKKIDGIVPYFAASSGEAKRIIETVRIDAVVTDIMRRRSNGSVSGDNGYLFFSEYLRPSFPTMPVVFHTRHMPGRFAVDQYSQYLSKWESQAKKKIELEMRLADVLVLYDAFADYSTWERIRPRLAQVQSNLLDKLQQLGDIWRLNSGQFEQLIAELLEKVGYSVQWVPGGKDGGIDIVASSDQRDYLIDVKLYKSEHSVSVELVRCIYGVAQSVGPVKSGRLTHGGIITSSSFTNDARRFRDSVAPRPLLCDSEWLRTNLGLYAPRCYAAGMTGESFTV